MNYKKTSNLFITGATGFVGTNLTEYLQKKYSIHLIPRELLWSDKNLLNGFKFNGKEAIIHLAGKAHDLKKTSNSKEYYKINYELTKKIYHVFLASSAEVFITLSSVKAVADHCEGVLTEDTLPSPQTHYGKSKLYAEEYIFSNKIPKGKRVYVLRPCMIHGPNNKGNLNLLYNFVKRGIPYPLAAFNNNRSLLSVENLCFVIQNLLERDDIPSGIYNVADEQSISTKGIVEIIGNVLSQKSIFWKINPKLIRAIAKMGDVLNLPVNSEVLQKLTENYVVSNKKIMVALGETLPLTTEEGLQKTIQSFLYAN
ncbi:NAD-dependent epimerase/dehydratase family protein [Emticicia sediminis]